jgi:hypothetical protein
LLLPRYNQVFTPSPSHSNSWEYALSLGRSKSEQYNVVSGLVDLRVNEPTQLDFSPHDLTARLDIASQSSEFTFNLVELVMLCLLLCYF